MDENLKTAREGAALLGEVIKAAGDNPDVKAAGKELGKAALTVSKTINVALLPLAAVNFGFEKARDYFNTRFQSDLASKAASIPPEYVVEPKASVAGPALQGLAFAHEEADLKEMYLDLLASAMDGRVAASAHPAFVEIIRQLSREEAELLRGGLKNVGGAAIAEIRAKKKGINVTSWQLRYRHLLHLRNLETGAPIENPRVPAYVDNWVRLGLFEVDYSKFLTGPGDPYEWVAKRPEYIVLEAREVPKGNEVLFQKGVMARTSLGVQFAKAVGILPREAEELPWG